MRLAIIGGVIGHQLKLFALAFLAPIGLALVDGDHSSAAWFAISLAVAYGSGWSLSRGFRPTRYLQRSEAFAVVSGTWLVVALFAGVPYLFHGLGPVDAFFESMSGLTTTGATILKEIGVEHHGRAFYLWRAMTQWFGGLGVIALFVVILPRLGVSGRQIFFAEASDASSEGLTPQVRSAAKRLWIFYILLTATQAGLLMATGFDLYEGVVHALTTLAAGGFSPHPASVGGYANPAAEWVFIFFMVISGTSYPLQYRAMTGKPGALFKDGEFLAYLGMCVIATFALAMWLGGAFDADAIRRGAFQVTSLASSTGYASENYDLWNDACKAILVLVMLIGGCAGSACGGPKVVRYLLCFKFVRREMRQVLHPRAVIPLRYKGRTIKAGVMRSVLTLVLIYLVMYVALGALVVVLEDDTPGMDLTVGMSASLACLGNIGPGFGTVGPAGHFADLGADTKVMLTLGMWLGRLEILAVLSLISIAVWRSARFGRDTGPDSGGPSVPRRGGEA